MIIGIGSDLIDIRRVAKVIERHGDRFLDRIFTDVERARAAMNGHHVRGLPQAQRREETGDAEHVIEMSVRQQDAIEPPEAGAAAQQLALRALAAINQDALARGLHQEGRMVALH